MIRNSDWISLQLDESSDISSREILSVVAKVHYCGEIKTLFCDGIELADTKAVTVMD